MGELFEHLSDAARSAMREAEQPRWSEPMLATLTHDRFSDPDWIFERKLDGERCLVFREGDGVRIVSRNRKDLNETYPELHEAAGQIGLDRFIADGEIVAFDGDVTSFSRLQGRLGITDREEALDAGVKVFLYLFDLLHADGRDLTGVGQRDRKSVLARLPGVDEPIRRTPHRNEDGEPYFREACGKGWEGVIAKRADAAYAHGRSRDWLKFKCGHRQEFVVVGYTEPEGERVGFGALIIGYHEDGGLRYAGRVGTGYDDAFLESFAGKLRRIERKTAPVEDPPDGAGGKGVRWVTPEYVCEVGFTEWTDDGMLRHPRFIGLRDDKSPEDVVRERAEDER